MKKSPIGFVRSFPQLIIRPGKEPPSVGSDSLEPAFGFWIYADDQEADNQAERENARNIPTTRQAKIYRS
jgi:hypothetical protein